MKFKIRALEHHRTFVLMAQDEVGEWKYVFAKFGGEVIWEFVLMPSVAATCPGFTKLMNNNLDILKNYAVRISALDKHNQILTNRLRNHVEEVFEL